MDTDNPFEGPTGERQPAAPSARTEARLTDLMQNYLIRSQPWMMVLGVMGMIGAGLLVLFGLGVVVLGIAGGGAQAGGLACMAPVYILMSLFYAYPSWSLIQASIAAKRQSQAMDAMNQELEMEQFLRHVQNLFRFLGIISLIVVLLYAALCLFGALLGGAGALSRF